MGRGSLKSPDGRYEIIDNTESYYPPPEEIWGNTNTIYDIRLVDIQLGTTKILRDSTVRGDHESYYVFSPDSKSLIFLVYENDAAPGHEGEYYPRFYSYDITTGNFIAYDAGQYFGNAAISQDGSKIIWGTLGIDARAVYFPSIAQFKLPTVSGAKVVGDGSGVLNAGDFVDITLELVGITQATDQEKMTLSLNTGGVATYIGSGRGQAYVFRYAVKDDEVADDLSITAVNLNGAVLRDAEGKDALISSDLSFMNGKLAVNGYIGSAGNENFYGTSGAETFEGRGGDDIYRIDNVGDRVIERKGGGYDTIVATLDFALAEGVEVETIRAAKSIGAADIKLTGNEFAQTLEGTDGKNVLDGGGGADIMLGKGGDDRYFVDSTDAVVVEERGGGFDTIVTTVSFALAKGAEIEALEIDGALNSFRKINLTGNEFANRLTGNNRDNILDGGAGIDILRGLGGNDTYMVDKAKDQVIEAKGGGTDTVVTTVSYALAAGQEIEALRLAASTGSANLNLTGNEFGQALYGNAGDNVLDGRGGADYMSGRGGDDTYFVQNSNDIAYEDRGQGRDIVVTTVSFQLYGEIETLKLAESTGSKALNLTGSEYGQTLIGNVGANRIDGGGGIDIMRGLGGNDTYMVDTAKDRVIEAKGSGTDTVVTTVSYALAAGQEIEALRLAASTGQANLNLTGNEFANAIRGNDGNNVLDGRSGSDILTGRAGLDAFVFSTKLGAGNVDRITDFAPVDDTIRLSEDIFTALGAGPLRAAAFKDLSVAGAKVDASDRILYDRDTGALSYDADGSGTAKAIKFAVLDNHAKLTHDDFFVV